MAKHSDPGEKKWKQRYSIITLMGPSGAGKTYAQEILRDRLGDRLHVAVSLTSRQPRKGEVDGIDYHYTDAETIKEMFEKGELVEFIEFGGNCYALSREELEQNKPVVVVMEPLGVAQLKKLGYKVLPVWIDAPDELRIQRMTQSRGEEAARERVERDDIRERLKLSGIEVDEKYTVPPLEDERSLLKRFNAVVDRIEERIERDLALHPPEKSKRKSPTGPKRPAPHRGL